MLPHQFEFTYNLNIAIFEIHIGFYCHREAQSIFTLKTMLNALVLIYYYA